MPKGRTGFPRNQTCELRSLKGLVTIIYGQDCAFAVHPSLIRCCSHLQSLAGKVFLCIFDQKAKTS